MEKATESVKSLMLRRVPELAGNVQLELIEKEHDHDVFEVAPTGSGQLLLRGSSAVAMATGLHWVLKHNCRRHISWCGSRMNQAKPILDGRTRVVLPHRHVVYMNYCTFNYSASWWDWDRWEWEIDFMAMNGVNMPLAMVGLEGVWYHSLLRMGMTDAEAREFLAGPAFLAWQWMANIDSHGGPLPKSWIDSHIDLGQKIIGRMLELGMNPIQQGFSGHVPAVFKEKFPAANIVQKEKWCRFPGTWQLDPLDPLFMDFGQVFLTEQKKFFGLHGHYAADPFHESTPPQTGDEYLRQVGRSIHQLLTSVDREAIWVMQSWSIQKEIACTVPKGKLLVVDLGGGGWRDTDGFWGHDFIVGQLHNFGGRINLHGDLAHIAANPFMEARKKYPQALGMGLFMEGITQNPVFYDMVFDMIWRQEGCEIGTWLKGYVERRYGIGDGSALKAWEILLKTAYREGTNGVESSSIIAARPALEVKKSGPNEGFILPYRPAELVEVWNLLLEVEPECGMSEGYRFDIVDIGRQVLSNLAYSLHQIVKVAFASRDLAAFDKASILFLDLLMDIDSLLETRREYRFSEWLESARRWGGNDDERKLYARNAAMLVTLWGPQDDPEIFDYSWREWSGLIRDYYLPRWKQFHLFLCRKLQQGEAYSEQGLPLVYGRETWRANEFYTTLAQWETAWINHPKLTANPAGKSDELTMSKVLYKKWMSTPKPIRNL
jgi:alpha-N-acetylglucosaminidase